MFAGGALLPNSTHSLSTSKIIKTNQMKYLTSHQFVELSELAVRANGKTTETIRDSLNFLINDRDRVVMYVGYNNATCDYARSLATQMLSEVVEVYPKFNFEITRSNRQCIEFSSIFGRSVLRFASWSTIPNSWCGMTLDEIYFDLDPETLFKDSQREKSKANNICATLCSMFTYHKPAKTNSNIKIF